MISLSDISLEKLENISKITLDDLRNPEIFSRLRELVAEIDTYGLLKEANHLLEDLIILLDKNKELIQSDPPLFKDCKRLIIYLKFLAIIAQSTDEIENLFKKHLLLAIWEEISLEERLRLLFLLSSDEVTGENIRRRIIKAMEANEEKIGKENLERGTGNPAVYPYVKNWLRDYISFFSAGKEAREELEQATYLNQNKNVKKLNQGEREILTGVIKLYDFLCFPPAERTEIRATGHIPAITLNPPKTEEINKIGNISKPAVGVNQTKEVSVDETINNLAELKQLAASYPPGSLERKAVEEELRKLSAKG